MWAWGRNPNTLAWTSSHRFAMQDLVELDVLVHRVRSNPPTNEAGGVQFCHWEAMNVHSSDHHRVWILNPLGFAGCAAKRTVHSQIEV